MLDSIKGLITNQDLKKSYYEAIFRIRSINRWSLFAILFAAALLMVVYISNVMAINELLAKNNKLKKDLILIRNNNELLRTEINKLQKADRITAIAQEKLGMIRAEEAPEVLK